MKSISSSSYRKSKSKVGLSTKSLYEQEVHQQPHFNDEEMNNAVDSLERRFEETMIELSRTKNNTSPQKESKSQNVWEVGKNSVKSRLKDKNSLNANFMDDNKELNETHRNMKSSKKLSTSTNSFLERTEIHARQAKEEISQLRIAAIKKEKLLLKNTPTINKKSQSLQRSIDDFFLWNRLKENKLKNLRDQQKLQEEAEVTGIPNIIKKTNETLERKRSLDDFTKIEDRLWRYGEIYRKNQEEALHKDIEKYSFHPRVAVHSATLPRYGDIAERLYQLAVQKREKEAEKAQKEKYELNSRHVIPVQTATKNNTPQPSVVSRLMEKGEDYRKRRLLLKQQQEEKLKAVMESRKINSKSEKIARSIKETSQERLLRSTGSVRDSTLLHLFQNHPGATLLNCRQAVGQTSKTCWLDDENLIDQKDVERQKQQKVIENRVDDRFYKRQIAWQNSRDAKCQTQKDLKLSLEMEECTFRPMIHSEDIDSSTKVDPTKWSHQFYKQNLENIRKREEKAKKEREKREAIEMTECTFRPELSPSPWPSSPSPHIRTDSKVEVDETEEVYEDINKKNYENENDDLESLVLKNLQEIEDAELNKNARLNEEESYSNEWKEFCTDDGYIYYFNERTKKSQWEPPLL